MFSEYHCKNCNEFTFVFLKFPDFVNCWKCGGEGCESTKRTFVLDVIMEKLATRSGENDL